MSEWAPIAELRELLPKPNTFQERRTELLRTHLDYGDRLDDSSSDWYHYARHSKQTGKEIQKAEALAFKLPRFLPLLEQAEVLWRRNNAGYQFKFPTGALLSWWPQSGRRDWQRVPPTLRKALRNIGTPIREIKFYLERSKDFPPTSHPLENSWREEPDPLEGLETPTGPGPICSYCGSPSECRNSSVIYGRSYGLAWVCANYPTCDAYVGCHPDTAIPLGRLADKALRIAKSAVHRRFDPIWRGRQLSRERAYAWLAERLGIATGECHIGLFDEPTCQRALAVLLESSPQDRSDWAAMRRQSLRNQIQRGVTELNRLRKEGP